MKKKWKIIKLLKDGMPLELNSLDAITFIMGIGLGAISALTLAIIFLIYNTNYVSDPRGCIVYKSSSHIISICEGRIR
jgi:hypothetical protein